MKHVLWLLLVPVVLLAGCGGSSAQASSFCQSVGTVKDDVQSIKSLKGNFSVSALTTDLKTLQTDVNKAIVEAKGAAKPQVSTLKSSIQQLKSTGTKVKDKTLTAKEALPTIKTQAQAVTQPWQSRKTALNGNTPAPFL